MGTQAGHQFVYSSKVITCRRQIGQKLSESMRSQNFLKFFLIFRNSIRAISTPLEPS